MRSAAVLAVALLALCAAPQAAIGQDAATVTTTFNLYGNSVEPFDGTKESAIKTSLAQSAGHGVTADNVKITVDKTYIDQQKNGRRLLQDANLVQPGVQLTSTVETTQQLATSVSQSIDSALGNNQIAQVFNQNGGQADYTAIVTASNTGGSSGGSNGGNTNSSGNNSSGNNTSSGNNSSSSGGGDKKSFPGWAIAVVVVLVLLLVGVIVGYCVWRKRAANHGVRAQDFGSAAYFNDGATEKGEGIGAKIYGAFAGVSAGAAGLAAKFKRAPPQVVQPAPAEPGLTRNPATPFSQIGFTGAGATSPGITRTTSSGAGNNYSGFVTRGPTTPKGSSLPTANPLYTAPPKTPGAGGYTPRRTGRLESLRDINDI